MRFRLIHAEKDHHEVSLLARVLGVSRQGYYAWAARQERGPSARARRDAELTGKIRDHHRASDEIYGAPRIHADLREIDGIRVGRKRVARLMRRAGLAGVSRRKGCRTTIADRQAVAASDLVKRKFSAAEPNRIWTADITSWESHRVDRAGCRSSCRRVASGKSHPPTRRSITLRVWEGPTSRPERIRRPAATRSARTPGQRRRQLVRFRCSRWA
ncbi:IS3 family transposase [Nonomuraea turcica]|uniref:IS3 family transposase n=1 Tax=Nonomuraea sp. G32 TaxID=3067274 RepID=UPI00352FF44A